MVHYCNPLDASSLLESTVNDACPQEIFKTTSEAPPPSKRAILWQPPVSTQSFHLDNARGIPHPNSGGNVIPNKRVWRHGTRPGRSRKPFSALQEMERSELSINCMTRDRTLPMNQSSLASDHPSAKEYPTNPTVHAFCLSKSAM
mmetsp:Transcript_59521/g.126544  ORF Transcript_59521/g.126544 Transcript_59521/m.126544 type:complete len:145 (-) Transcript_59521:153-587(-)